MDALYVGVRHMAREHGGAPCVARVHSAMSTVSNLSARVGWAMPAEERQPLLHGEVATRDEYVARVLSYAQQLREG